MSVWAGTKAATSRRSRRPATARDDHFARPEPGGRWGNRGATRRPRMRNAVVTVRRPGARVRPEIHDCRAKRPGEEHDRGGRGRLWPM